MPALKFFDRILEGVGMTLHGSTASHFIVSCLALGRLPSRTPHSLITQIAARRVADVRPIAIGQ